MTEETTGLPESEPSEISFSEIPDPTPVTGLHDEPPDVKLCEGCGEPIHRAPGQRGKLPKFHPSCRPTSSSRSSGNTKRTSSGKTKAEVEAELIADRFRQTLNKTAIMVGIVDTFDGYAIAVQSKPLSESVELVLASYDSLRKPLLDAKGTSGVFSLVLTSTLIVLPILAHHGIIPAKIGGKPLGEFLEKLPQFMKTLYDQAEQAEKQIAEKLEEKMAEEKAA